MTCNVHALLASVHLCHPIHFPEIHGRIWGIDAVVPLVFLFCSTDILGLLSYFSPLPNNAYIVYIKRQTHSSRQKFHISYFAALFKMSAYAFRGKNNGKLDESQAFSFELPYRIN